MFPKCRDWKDEDCFPDAYPLDDTFGKLRGMPHLVSLSLVPIHLLNEHESQLFLLLALLPAPLELCHSHLGLDVLIIFLLVIRAVIPNGARCAPASSTPATGSRHGPAPDRARCSLLLSSLASLVGLALAAALLLRGRTDRNSGAGHHTNVVVIESYTG